MNNRLCEPCRVARLDMKKLLEMPWEKLIDQYEFMIVFASFRRLIIFYSNMDTGQLRNKYAQIVAFCPATVMIVNTLIARYTSEEACPGDVPHLTVPCELSQDVSKAIGNRVPEGLVYSCISERRWSGYETMLLATFASVATIRSGPLKYIAAIRASTTFVTSLHVIVALAVTGWTKHLAGSLCFCNTWKHAVQLISCAAKDTETGLVLQSEERISSYICTLLDLPLKGPATYDDSVVDYHLLFKELSVEQENNK